MNVERRRDIWLRIEQTLIFAQRRRTAHGINTNFPRWRSRSCHNEKTPRLIITSIVTVSALWPGKRNAGVSVSYCHCQESVELRRIAR